MAERARRATKSPFTLTKDSRPLIGRAEQLEIARNIVLDEAKALNQVAESLDDSFLNAVDRIVQLQGSLILSGMGKAGFIGRKLAATFASTGTPSHFLHPAEAIHGDLGKVTRHDLVLMLSHSGATPEVTRILPSLQQQCSGLIAITADPMSPLARAADLTILLPRMREACSHGLAPSTSTTSMLAIGDALALLASQLRGFTAEDFGRFHPGGALGRKLSRVEEVMRPLDQCRVASAKHTVREVLIRVAKTGRRIGAIMLVDEEDCLCGIFTDSDLARLMEQRSESELDGPIEQVMTRRFHAIQFGARFEDALFVLANKKFSELPVIDDHNRPVGMIDITDVLSMVGPQYQPHSGNSNEPAKPNRAPPPSIRLFQESTEGNG